ncbi:MAG: hypothetical protein RXO24_07825 [Acidilobus sp.]
MSESVHEMPPGGIVDRLMMAVMDGWMNDMLNSELHPWDFAEGTLFELDNMTFELDNMTDETLNREDLVDFLAQFAYDAADNLWINKKDFAQLWNKLTPEQRKAFLKDFYHGVLLYGLKTFLDMVGGYLSLKDVEDYLNGKISFQDLIKKAAKELDIEEDYAPYDEEAKSFWAGASLAYDASDEELKELVRKYVLPQAVR